MAKKHKLRAVHVTLIQRKDDKGQEHSLYSLMDTIVGQHHPELIDALIGLAWNDSWSEDIDGHVQLGKLTKASDLDRELHAFDFIIQLNADFMADFSPEQQTALIDHELCHGAPVLDDKSSDQIFDERGRACWRTRKHDIEEFSVVAKRHGGWKRDLERFAEALRESRKTPLLDTEKK